MLLEKMLHIYKNPSSLDSFLIRTLSWIFVPCRFAVIHDSGWCKLFYEKILLHFKLGVLLFALYIYYSIYNVIFCDYKSLYQCSLYQCIKRFFLSSYSELIQRSQNYDCEFQHSNGKDMQIWGTLGKVYLSHSPILW